jgi:hypothetical protein
MHMEIAESINCGDPETDKEMAGERRRNNFCDELNWRGERRLNELLCIGTLSLFTGLFWELLRENTFLLALTNSVRHNKNDRFA